METTEVIQEEKRRSISAGAASGEPPSRFGPPDPTPTDFQSVKSRSFARGPMAGKTVHHLDFDTLADINRRVVELTGEPHAYSPADGEKLAGLVKEVEQRADNQELQEAVPEKAALLVYKIASGQYFRAGNKRTALVAGLVFLAKNGYKIDVTNSGFVSTVDKVGVAAATLDDLYGVLRRLAVKSKVERKGWEKLIEQSIESDKEFLTDQAKGGQ